MIGRIEIVRKEFFVYPFFLLFLFLQPLFPLPNQVTLTLRPERLVAGQVFSLVIYLDFLPPAAVVIQPPVIPPGVKLITGPNLRPDFRVDPATGVPEKKLKITYTFKAKQGRYVLLPFEIRDKDHSFQTPGVLLEVGNFLGGRYRKPLTVLWQSAKTRLLLGENLPLTLVVADEREVRQFQTATASLPHGGLFVLTDLKAAINKTEIGGFEFFQTPVATYLFTPTRTGLVTIPGGVVKNGFATQGAPLQLRVDPLPEAIKASSALGSFRLVSWLEPDTSEGSLRAVLHIRLEGEGNFNFLTLPQPLFQGVKLSYKKEENQFVFSWNGYQGFKEEQFFLELVNPLQAYTRIPAYAWLDKKSGRVVREREKRLDFSQLLSVSRPREKQISVPRLLYSAREIERMNSVRFYTQPLSYLLLLPAVLFILLSLFLPKRTPLLLLFIAFSLPCCFIPLSVRDSQLIGQAVDAGREGRFQDAVALYAGTIKRYPLNPALLANLGLAHYHLDHAAFSVLYLRRALEIAPANKRIEAVLADIEQRFRLSDQYPLKSSLNPDIFFWLLVGVGSLLGAAVFFLRRRAGAFTLITLVMGGLLVTGLVLGLVINSQKDKIGVVKQNHTALVKVPSASASQWLRLNQGAAVHIKNEVNGYGWVETGSGVEGWIKADQLLTLSEAVY